MHTGEYIHCETIKDYVSLATTKVSQDTTVFACFIWPQKSNLHSTHHCSKASSVKLLIDNNVKLPGPKYYLHPGAQI